MHKAFVRIGLVHIAASNLCVWAYTSILETSEEVRLSTSDRNLESSVRTDEFLYDNSTINTTPGTTFNGQ